MTNFRCVKTNGRHLDVSVVVPAYNCESNLKSCLVAIQQSIGCSFEIIVVDDSSTDRTSDVAKQLGVKLIRLPKQSGPAVARNRGGVLAKSDLLVFIDSDVIVSPTVLRDFKEQLQSGEVSAAFGSYDAKPTAQSYISLYKNLMHHFFHQTSAGYTGTFWSGCGAINKSVFFEYGGFNEHFDKPSIEDIEFGMRITSAGHLIRICPEIQAKHTKRWTLENLIRTDVFLRGVPWTRMILRNGAFANNLNTSLGQRISVLVAGLICLIFLQILFENPAFASAPFAMLVLLSLTDALSARDHQRRMRMWLSVAFLLTAVAIFLAWEPKSIAIAMGSGMLWLLNQSSLRFLGQSNGTAFLLLSLPLHLLYFISCGFSFLIGVIYHLLGIPFLPRSSTG